jgi:trans-aconitate methyltransferase
MAFDITSGAQPLASRDFAYTTARADIAALVPAGARKILDVGCSNGALGRYLKLTQADRTVWGIEFDSLFASEAAMHLDHVVQADLNGTEWHGKLAGQGFIASFLRTYLST